MTQELDAIFTATAFLTVLLVLHHDDPPIAKWWVRLLAGAVVWAVTYGAMYLMVLVL